MAVRLRLRAELRSRLASWLGLALLVGLAAGLVIAVAAGARRTETAVPRSVAAANLSDVGVSQFGYSTLDFDRVARLPMVDYAFRNDNFYFTGRTDSGRPLDVGRSGLIASPDRSAGTSREAPELVDGRRADPDRVDEAVADEEAARMLDLGVGSRLTVRFAAADQTQDFLDYVGDPKKFPAEGPRLTFRIVGISTVYSTPSRNYPEIRLTSAFHRSHAADLARGLRFDVYLEHGEADIPLFERQVEEMAGRAGAGFDTSADLVSQVQRGVHIQAAALWVLAALAAVFALLVVGQALARQTLLESPEYPTLRALGMTNSQLLGLSLARTASIGAAGALLAGGLAIALSPLAPVGSVARKMEPDPGVSLDALVVFGGAAAALLLVLLAGAVPAWRNLRRLGASSGHQRGGPGRGSPIVARLARAGAPPTAVSGVRMALEPGQGPTAVPVRTTIAGTVIAIAAIATALTFSASFERLARTPSLYGQNWDAQFGDGYAPDLAGEVYPALRRHRLVGSFAGGTIGEASIAGARVGVLALEQVQGSIGATVTSGREPTAPDEVLLAPKTLDEAGAGLGDIVPMVVGKRSSRARVVGAGILTDIEGAEPLLGKGALLTFDGYRRLVPDAKRNYFLLRVTAGADKRKAIASLPDEAGASGGAEPLEITNFSRIDTMPVFIGGLLGLIAVATLGHTLVTSLRRRRRDLAILKMLGFERGQISRVVAWQATTIVAIALLIGAPLGVAAGRWGWRTFAESLGVVPDPSVPLAPILLLVPAALLLANVIAAVPARLAANTRPALVLRAE